MSWYYWYQSSTSFTTWLRWGASVSPNDATITGANDSLLDSNKHCLIDSENSPNPLHCNTEDDEHPCIGSEAWWNGIWKFVENCELSTSSDFLKFPTDPAARIEPSVRIFWAGGCDVRWVRSQVTCYAMLGDDQWHGHSSRPVQPGPAQFPNFPQQECGLTTLTLITTLSLLHSHSYGKILVGKNNSKF